MSLPLIAIDTTQRTRILNRGVMHTIFLLNLIRGVMFTLSYTIISNKNFISEDGSLALWARVFSPYARRAFSCTN